MPSTENSLAPARPALVAAIIGAALYIPAALRYGDVFPDSSAYLDIGRELFRSGRFVVKINLTALWTGAESPALSYYNPLFCVWVGLWWKIFGAVGPTIVFTNGLFAAANGLLTFVFAARLFSRRAAWIAMILFLTMSVTLRNMLFLATEQPGLTSFLAAVALLVSPNRKNAHLLGAGLVLFLGFLTQVSSLANSLMLLAGFAATAAFRERRFLPAAAPLAAFFGFFLVYQFACAATTGHLYPYYPTGAQAWSISERFGPVHYADAFPVIRGEAMEWPMRLALTVRFIGEKADQYVGQALDLFLLFAALIPVAAAATLKRRRWDAALLLVAPAVANIVLILLIYYWLDFIEILRYAVFPAALLVPVAADAAVATYDAMRARERTRTAAASAAVFSVMLLGTHLILTDAGILLRPGRETESNLRRETRRSLAYVREQSSPADVIAVEPNSDQIALSFYLDRPVVALPNARSSTRENHLAFRRIFHPAFVMFRDESLGRAWHYKNHYSLHLRAAGCGPDENWQSDIIEVWRCG
ncbi:hypothetical protein K8I61_10750 [bacterium]|nr:hypothetical protein [bacterium]